MSAMLRWIQENQTAVLIAGASVVAFAASIIAVRWVVTRIPADYFTHRRRPRGMIENQHPALRPALRVGKNILGWAAIIAGAAMLVLPGQGVLTLFIGFLLVDLPGKYRLEKWLVSKPWVHRPINWFRRRAGREPLARPART